ncbi:unnamed protein product [Durusdinium trenchii]|uniref:Uncharacterized protein n=2 Tax=Durusdinium trenchii TaxID=1381693 RepID=A0ABP0K8E2_9DINO
MEQKRRRTASEKTSCTWCRIGFLVVLIVVAITAPIWAFTIASCTSTRPCRIGQMLTNVEAQCAEGGGARSEELLHGDVCTLVCDDPRKKPTIAALQCLDGNASESEIVQCMVPPDIVGPVDLQPTLAANAITAGEPRLVCGLAARFTCEAAAGATSILIQLDRLSKAKCDEIFSECRQTNPVFTFQEFVKSAAALAYEADPNNLTTLEAYLDNPGRCTLGCFVELFSTEQLQSMQNEITVASSQASGAFPMAAGQFATSSFCGDNPGPACIRVQGFCDPSQDGDYYKHPVCVSGQAQWSKIDGSLRIRYDGDERNGQAGKWVLETDVVDLMASSYGTEIARQPTFNPTPSLGDTIWNLKCRYPSNDGLGSFYIQYRTKIVELVSCTCDSQIDCNGAGVAIGSKENGPNCLCECSPDRAGDSCEIPLCQVPGVQNSLDPACEEGNWIYPNGVCTPSCQEGYQPNHPSFTCTADGTFLLPLGFTCDQIWVNEAPVDEFGNTPDAYKETTSTTPPECSDFDCVFHGTATGKRREDGSCECNCDKGYTGPQCRSIVGDCLAPLHKNIPNSALSTCVEGSRPNLVCTARCADMYYPVPETLECQGTQLVPEKFRCFGGPTTEVRWCQAAQITSLVFSGCTALGLIVACYTFQRNQAREFQNYLHNDKLVEGVQDVHGNYNVVRMTNGTEYHSKLPDHILAFDPREPPKEGSAHEEEDHDNSSTLVPEHGLPSLQDEGTYTPEVRHSIGGLPGQVEVLALSGPGIRRGAEVILQNIVGRPELDGAHGWVLDYSHETGLYEVDLEGVEILKMIPEYCLQDVELSAEPPAIMSAPGPEAADANWLVSMRDLENKVEASRQERYKKFASEQTKEATEREARVKEALQESAAVRADLEGRLRMGLRTGDAEMLREAIAEVHELLKQPYLAIAPPASLSSLQRVLETAESRLEQFDTIKESRQRAEDYAERVRTGKAADWKMTSADLLRYVQECNPGKVQAGLKAQLPVFLRSSDGQRFTILHDACRDACLDEPRSEKAQKRIEVVRLLCEARANKNAVDMKDRTPLDLALELGGPKARRRPSVRELRKLGLRTAEEAAMEMRGETILVDEESEDEECEAEKPQDEPLLVEVFPEAEKLDEESEPTGPRSFAPPIPEASPSQPDAVHPEDGTPEAT